MTQPLPLALADFAGRWALHRQIHDARGPEGAFQGTAQFTAHAEGLLYTETGLLRLGAHAFKAERSYLWSSPSPGHIQVCFADGRAFHGLELSANPTALHACDPDTYVVDYSFDHWPDWRCCWRVTGPRKDYRMVSDYRRLIPA